VKVSFKEQKRKKTVYLDQNTEEAVEKTVR